MQPGAAKFGLSTHSSQFGPAKCATQKRQSGGAKPGLEHCGALGDALGLGEPKLWCEVPFTTVGGKPK